jgi:ABC-type polar amino acid transport system ATPase subunit
MIEVKGLKKSFGTLEVLKGVDLTVPANQVVCLLGPSGSARAPCYDA